MPVLASVPMNVVDRLRAAGCVFAEEEAALLAETATSPDHLEALVAERVGGLPLEHVVGWAEFCGQRIVVTKGVFVPRHRTELLVDLATELKPAGWDTGRVRRAHGFDRSGTRFYILDDLGALTVFQRQGGAWVNAARIAGAVPAMPAAAPFPAFTANGARDEVYLTDPVARQLVVVNSTTQAVAARRDLGHVPAYAIWLGIKR